MVQATQSGRKELGAMNPPRTQEMPANKLNSPSFLPNQSAASA